MQNLYIYQSHDHFILLYYLLHHTIHCICRTYYLIQTFFHHPKSDKSFLKCVFITFQRFFILIRNLCNEFMNSIFSSVKSNWFAKSIINAHDFISKTARNMLLVFFGIGSITIFVSLWHPFLKQIQSQQKF